MTNAGDNKDQAEFWASAAGQKWITHQDVMDATLRPVLDLVLARTDLRRGEKVLDIGCGTGASTIEAARSVGPDGAVLGLDISPPLLDLARRRADRAECSNVAFQLADAQSDRPGGAPYDALISRFGVMFFSDPVAAFANMARAMRPDARMVLAAWGPLAENPWFQDPNAAAKQRLGSLPPTDRNAPGPLAFHDAERVVGLIKGAGLVSVNAETVTLSLTPPGTARDAADITTTIGPAARAIQELNAQPADIAALKRDIQTRFERFETDAGLMVPAAINLFTCKVP